MSDHFQHEIDLTREIMDVEELLTFQLTHDIQVIRGEDYQYICYINGVQCGSTGLTPMYAMVTGVREWTRK